MFFLLTVNNVTATEPADTRFIKTHLISVSAQHSKAEVTLSSLLSWDRDGIQPLRRKRHLCPSLIPALRLHLENLGTNRTKLVL